MTDPWQAPDAPGTRSIRKELELHADPDAVWQAVATGPGISCWFYPTELEPRAGGAIVQRFDGGAEERGRVTAYEPGRRLTYGASQPGPDSHAAEEHAAEGHTQAFEFLLEARAGGSTVLRFIHSGFSTDARFDDEYGTVDNGWDLFFGILAAYVEHFAGQPGASAQAMAQHAGPGQDAWARLAAGLGLDAAADGLAVGDAVTVSPGAGASMTGEVDVLAHATKATGVGGHVLGLRSADGVARFAVEGREEGPVSIWAARYVYGDSAAATARAAEAQLGRWVAELFPAPAEAATPDA